MTKAIDHSEFSMKNFFKVLFTIAFPIALQNLLTTTATMVDTIMIGSEGELAVAAVGTCSQITSLFCTFYFGLVGGAQMFFAQYWGAKDTKGINRTFGLALSFMLLVSLIFASIAIVNPTLLLRVYTDKENIIETAIPYLRIVGFSYPLRVGYVLISFLLRSTERVKVPLYCSIVGLVVNFVLNWLLIYGRFGLPKMGPAGAAVGTLVSAAVNFILLLYFLLRDKKKLRIRFQEMFSFGNGFFGTYLKKCLPIICNEALYGVGQMLINIVIGRQSESAIAAMAAFRVLEGFVFAFFGGLADAASVIVGKNIGSGKHMDACHYAKSFSFLCPSVTFITCLAFVIFNEPLLGLFGLGAEAIYYGKYMLMIYLVAGTIRTCNYIMNTCYRAGGETMFGSMLEIIALFVISVPATWVAGMIFELPFLAIFAFVYADEIIRLICELRYTYSYKWIKPVTEEGRATLPAFKQMIAEKRGKRA